MVAQGFTTGGRRVFGYRSEPVPGMAPITLAGGKVKPPPKRRVPDEEEAFQVRRAFQIFEASDNMGEAQRYLRSVCPERKWPLDSVRRLLTNEV